MTSISPAEMQALALVNDKVKPLGLIFEFWHSGGGSLHFRCPDITLETSRGTLSGEVLLCADGAYPISGENTGLAAGWYNQETDGNILLAGSWDQAKVADLGAIVDEMVTAIRENAFKEELWPNDPECDGPTA